MAQPPRNRSWIWYFVIVGALTIAATLWLALFNLSLQLTLEEWSAQKHLWDEKGPRDYDMGYTVKENDDPVGYEYLIRVRNGKIAEAWKDGNELRGPADFAFDMERLFGWLKKNLDHDLQPGKPKVYTRTRFHRENGAILEYVRRVMGARERLEISVKSFRFGPDLPREKTP